MHVDGYSSSSATHAMGCARSILELHKFLTLSSYNIDALAARVCFKPKKRPCCPRWPAHLGCGWLDRARATRLRRRRQRHQARRSVTRHAPSGAFRSRDQGGSRAPLPDSDRGGVAVCLHKRLEAGLSIDTRVVAACRFDEVAVRSWINRSSRTPSSSMPSRSQHSHAFQGPSHAGSARARKRLHQRPGPDRRPLRRHASGACDQGKPKQKTSPLSLSVARVSTSPLPSLP